MAPESCPGFSSLRAKKIFKNINYLPLLHLPPLMDFRNTKYDLLSEQSGWDIQYFLVADLVHFKSEFFFPHTYVS